MSMWSQSSSQARVWIFPTEMDEISKKILHTIIMNRTCMYCIYHRIKDRQYIILVPKITSEIHLGLKMDNLNDKITFQTGMVIIFRTPCKL